KTRTAIFVGSVHVKDPQFLLDADKLTALLRKQVTEDKTAAKPSPVKNAGTADDKQGGGLDTAIAEGHVTIVQDKDDPNDGAPTTKTAATQKPVAQPKSENGSNGGAILRTDKLVKIYGGRAVVNGIDINLKRGEIVGLLGPNGAGKTTSFYMIVGLVRPNSGRVIFCDTDVTDYPMYKRARLGMGYLPQEESIFRKMTVEQNIMAILETLPTSKAERRNRCDQLLHQFGIERIAKNTALTLSGGEKR